MAIHKHDNQNILDNIISAPVLTDNHNLLSNLEGGDPLSTIPTYYHLSASEHSILTLGGDATNLHKHYTSGILLQGVNVDPGYEITLDNTIDYMWSSGRIFGFALTDNGNGTINLAYGVAMLRTSSTMLPYFSPLIPCKINAQTGISLTDNATNYVYADYNSGDPSIGVTTDITTISATDKVIIYVITRVNNQLDYISVGSYQSDSMAKYARKTVAQHGGAEYGYGVITSEADTRKLSITEGAFYYINEKVSVGPFNTNVSDTFTYVYRAATPGTYTRVTGQTTINNTNYDNGTGTLATLDNSKYGVHWVYLVLDAPTKIYVIYGQAQYADVASADAAGIPTDLPPEVRAYSTGVLIAKIVVKKSATNLYSIQNPYTVKFSSSTATSHNGLSGLQGGTTDEYYHLTSAQYTGLSAVAATQISYASSLGVLAGSNGFTFDATNRRIGLSDSSTLFAPSTSLHLSKDTNTGLRADTYSNTATAVAGVQLYKSRGTAASPSAIQSGDSMGFVGVYGRGATAFSSTSRSKIEFLAAENWTDSAHGTYITFHNTAATTTTLVERMRLFASGGLQIGGAFTTIGTVNKLTINPNVTVDNTAVTQINTGSNTNKGLVLQRNSASQTANLIELQASTGAVLAGFDLGGKLIQPTQSVSANATITGSRVKYTGSTASQTLTLPAGVEGLEIKIRNTASVSVTIARAGGDTIEGETSLILNVGESVVLTYIGTDWTAF